jgi:hypothetical protein
MVGCFELVLLDDLESSVTTLAKLKDTHELVGGPIAVAEQLHELIRELLEIDHDLLLCLEYVIVLL